MVNSQIQHIQIDNTPEGLLILINGKPIPSLGWDGESLVATAEVMEEFGADVVPLLDKILPLDPQHRSGCHRSLSCLHQALTPSHML